LRNRDNDDYISNEEIKFRRRDKNEG
jgi:hypothetical protein